MLIISLWLTRRKGSALLSLNYLCISCTQAISAATSRWTALGLSCLCPFCMSISLQGAPSQLNPLDFEIRQKTLSTSPVCLLIIPTLPNSRSKPLSPDSNTPGCSRQAHEECSETSFLFFQTSCHQSPILPSHHFTFVSSAMSPSSSPLSLPPLSTRSLSSAFSESISIP